MRLHLGSGFALTEVLIASALLAVGLLGHMALLVSGLRTESNAANLATAATLSADMGERIRANPSAGAAYALDPEAADPAPTAVCAVAAPFDAVSRAACDLAEWREAVVTALPGADVRLAAVNVAGTTAILYSITVVWVAWGQADVGGVYTLQVQV